MTKVKFHITEERRRKVPLRAKIAIQAMEKNREVDLRGLRDLLCVFLVDENDEYLPKEKAQDVIEELDEDEQEQAGTALVAALAEFSLPKSSGKPSSSPSSTAEPDPGG